MRAGAWLGAILMVACLAERPAGAADAVMEVQYVDVAPAEAGAAATLLREHGAAVRQAAGNLRFTAYAEAGRPNRLVTVVAWRDPAAAEAFGAGPVAAALQGKLDPLRITGVDRRMLTLLAGDPLEAPAAGGAGAVQVVTHLDSIPPFKDEAAAALQALAAASRAAPGVLRYQVLQQANRPNHFKLLETWTDRAAFEAHLTAPATRGFRDHVQKGAGSPYDERLMTVID